MLTRTSKGESLLLLALEVLSLGMELSLKLEVSERILEVCVYVTNQFSLLLLDLKRSVNKQIRMIRVKGTYLFPEFGKLLLLVGLGVLVYYDIFRLYNKHIKLEMLPS